MSPGGDPGTGICQRDKEDQRQRSAQWGELRDSCRLKTKIRKWRKLSHG